MSEAGSGLGASPIAHDASCDYTPRMRHYACVALLSCLALLNTGFDWIGKVEKDAQKLKADKPRERRAAIIRLRSYDIELVTPYLLAAVRQDPDAEVRIAAALALGDHGVRKAVPTLLGWLDHPDVLLRKTAAQVLGRIRARESVRDLIRAADDIDKDVRLNAVQALGAFGDSRVIVPLIRRLDDDKSDVREAAVIQLGGIGDHRAVIPLVGAFEDPSIKVRAAAIEAVGKLQIPTTVAPLLRQLSTRIDAVQLASVTALGRLGAVEAVPALIERLAARPTRRNTRSSDATEFRAKVAYALGQIAKSGSPQTRPALVALVHLLANHGLRAAAKEALRQAGQHAVPVLIDNLRGTIPGHFAASVELLREFGDARATPVLIDELKRDRVPRSLVLSALAKTRGPEALMPLLTLLSDRNVEVRLEALIALKPLITDGRQAQAADVLVLRLSDSSPDIRRLAAQYLGTLKARIAVQKLIQRTRDSDRGVRKAAVDALGTIADPRATATLIAILSTGPPALRASAANALAYIGDARAESKLLALAANTESPSRVHAIRALSAIVRRKPTTSSVNALNRFARDSNLQVSLSAVAALAASRSAAAGPTVLSLAQSVDPNRRRSALSALGSVNTDKALPVLTGALTSRDERVSAAAAAALAALKRPEALEPLATTAGRSSWATAINTTLALARYGTRKHIPELAKLSHHRNRFVRANAILGLGRLKASTARSRLARLVERDNSDWVRIAAIRALSQLGSAKATKIIKRASQDQHGEVKKTAQRALRSSFAPETKWSWLDALFVESTGGQPVPREPYVALMSDGFALAFYTDARGRFTSEHFPAGPSDFVPKSLATRR